MKPNNTLALILTRLFLTGAMVFAMQGCLPDSDSGNPDSDSGTNPNPDDDQDHDNDHDDNDGNPSPYPGISAPGGFLEDTHTTTTRALLSEIEINSFVPERGAFDFPSPYNTRGVRITNASDCQGSDCVNYVGYSYWKNMNNHVNDDEILIVLGLKTDLGGQGPTLYRFNKETEELVKDGPLFEASSRWAYSTLETSYFSASMPTKMYMRDNSKLMRFDVIDRTWETVFDATDEFGSGYDIWHTHSSNDDGVHSATLRNSSTGSELGCLVYNERDDQFQYFERMGTFDECHIDKGGDYLLIKENATGWNDIDSRIINLVTGEQRILANEDGGGGHSDMGYGSVVAADNWNNLANAWRVWDFTRDDMGGELVYSSATWDAFSPNHVSFSHARDDIPLSDQYICGSAANRTIAPQANDILCFTLNGSREALVVAPVMTDLMASGGNDSYAQMPKGNLDITGQYFLWTTNMGGDRLDAFLVKIPAQLLNGPDGNGDDSDDDSGDDSGDMTGVSWTDLANVTADGNSLTKTGGCDGCNDAGAMSAQEISGSNGMIEFTATSTDPLLTAGLSNQGSITSSGSIDFGIRLQSGIAEVRESGVYRGETTFSAGDVFGVKVEASAVHYYKNGTLFHSTSQTPPRPLRAHAVLTNSGASISNALITD